jgi:hypothetical protein
MIMCQCNDCNNPRIVLEDESPQAVPINVKGTYPVKVDKFLSSDITTFQVSVDLPSITNGVDGKDGEDGKDGISATIKLGTVLSGDNAQVTNSGTDTDVRLNFVLPKGKDGIDGKDGEDGKNGIDGSDGRDGIDGLTKGIKAYLLATGNEGSAYEQNMGTYAQGSYVDTGDDTTKRLRIMAWVGVGNVQNWTTLRLSSSSFPTYNGSTVIQQVTMHSEATTYVTQHQICAVVTTSNRYIGFTFGDAVSGSFSSDGESYGEYGIEVFILN